ncbi:tryptophan 7-halogenase [Catenovulum sp. 2E275]|uniref:tryptophan halogenase family protein n=1 Tax=Catenovulum sp. 2E275 TaxID=2980497 RepID=UPI0021D2A6ED|nr:tryptophan halogenase family protein [Catenovulum sp. 2E275]MCU4677243.1 tryptophan 7-halogenase [Catenovulum sp. 2E275]
MQTKQIRKIVIVGGGTAGWMTAAAFANRLPSQFYQIVLVESEQIGTVGVGESTIPHIRQFNEVLGINEAEFVRETHATFKLGIQFKNWGKQGDSYIHPFGEVGELTKGIDFHHYWLKANQHGLTDSFDRYSFLAQAALEQKFPEKKQLEGEKFSQYAYSYHIDATAYARFLRKYAEEKGVVRVEGKVELVKQDATQAIESLVLQNGESIAADFFIDCSGFRGLLIDQTLNVPFIDWSHWLPVNSAIVAQTELTDTVYPMTIASAHKAGWAWKIPLQHRMGNGLVYDSDYMQDQEAADLFNQHLQTKPITEPRVLRFKTGCRQQYWHKNCVAIGLSGGFLEPLESTSIYLIQQGIFKFLELLPNLDDMSAEQKEYNQVMDYSYQTIRDFIILHYHLNQKTDSEFWLRAQNMTIPDSLKQRLATFAESGRTELGQFGVWPAVCIGQNFLPAQYDSRLDWLSEQELTHFMQTQKQQIDMARQHLPTASQYIQALIR